MNNILEFAQEISKITGQKITEEHIIPTTEGHSSYIAPPSENSPYLLNSPYSYFVVELHPSDFDSIQNGKISPHEYIITANWLVGYFWGGGNMLKGAFYQPMELLKNQIKIRKYLQILYCRGLFFASRYKPSKETCMNCMIEDCNFSLFKDGSCVIEEYDPRLDFFRILSKRFKSDYPGYTLLYFYANSKVPSTSIILLPRGRYSKDTLGLAVYVSEETINDLLTRKVIPDFDYVAKFKLLIGNDFSDKYLELTEENLKAVFSNVYYASNQVKCEDITTKYLFSQSSGNSTTRVIIENPVVKDGVVYATKIGKFVGWDDERKEIYTTCTPVKFIAGGGPWNMTEYKGKIYSTVTD